MQNRFILSFLLLAIPVMVVDCSKGGHSAHIYNRTDPIVDEPPAKTINRFNQQLNIDVECATDCATNYKDSVKSLSRRFLRFVVEKNRISTITLDDSARDPSFDARPGKLYLPTPVSTPSLDLFFREMGKVEALENDLKPVRISFGSLPMNVATVDNVYTQLKRNEAAIFAHKNQIQWIIFVASGASQFNDGVWSVTPQEVETDFTKAFCVLTHGPGCK